MQEIYVVKVKTRPETSTLYPSERRYSASTVGGLGLVHLLLGGTTLLLASLGLVAERDAGARYGGAVAMGVAAIVAAGTAALAWRRWYIDNNIRHFLICSTATAATAVVCIILTAIAMATAQEKFFQRHIDAILNTLAPTTLPATDLDANVTDFISMLNETVYTEELMQEGTVLDDILRRENASQIFESGSSFEAAELREVRSVLLVNILIAAGLELMWCILSVRLAWRGMNNTYSDAEGASRVVEGAEKTSTMKVSGRPDIISNYEHQRVIADSKQTLNDKMNVNICGNTDEYLPKQESSVEYDERVRKFLASNE